MRPRAIAAALLVLAISACSGSDAPKKGQTQQSPPPNIRTGVARIGAVPLTVSAYGTVSGGANAQASLAFPEAGRIARVDVVVGQHVETGQQLAQLDTAAFDAAVAQAQANLQAARADYSKTAAGARPEQRAQTSAQIEQARTQLSVAQAQYDRQRQLLRIGIASQADADAAKAALANARAQLRVLQEQRSEQTHPLLQDVQSAQAQVAQAQAALQAAAQARSYATLTAPFSGIVTARLHNTGESVDSSTPVVQIAASQAPTFTAQFDPASAMRINVGDTATVAFSDSKTRAEGRVVAKDVAQTAEGREVPVLIRLQAGSAAAGPGAYGQASVRVGTARGMLVPSSAIVQDPATGSTLVFRKTGDHYNPISVTVKGTAGGDTWIGGGDLRAGDAIVVSGAAELMTAPQSGEGD